VPLGDAVQSDERLRVHVSLVRRHGREDKPRVLPR
jgi:hypothetical protein